MNYTTLNKIRKHNPCSDGWKKLLDSLNKTQADDEPLSLLHILNSNGLNDALWALRASDASDKDMRLYAVWCARQVQHLTKDQRYINAIDVAERYANGEATVAELEAARAASAASAAWEAWEARASWAAASAAASAASAAWAASTASTASTASAEAWDAQKERFIQMFCQ